MSVKAVLMVGGPTKGTRFRPISLSSRWIPKPLFPIAGRPMILHHIEACAKLPSLKSILMIGFYEEEDFSEFVRTTSAQLNIPIRYVREPESLGTAGGLHHFRKMILDGNPEYIFAMHCDICSKFPLQEMLQFHKTHGGPCTILGKRVSKDEARAFGCMAMDPNTHEMMHYAEKPESFVTDLINCGIYLFSPKIFDTFAEVAEEFKQKRSEASVSSPAHGDELAHHLESLQNLPVGHIRLEQDILTPLSGRKLFYVLETTGPWMQIKSLGAALRCSEIYMDAYRTAHPELLYPGVPPRPGPHPEIQGTVIIHPSAEVHPTARLGPNVFISAGAKIGPGARVKHSIVLDNADIRAHACVLYAVVGWASRIAQWARVEGRADFDPSKTDQSNGICMFGEGVTVEPELVVRSCIVLPHKALAKSCHNEVIL
eukprot:tig00000093_g3538.t1